MKEIQIVSYATVVLTVQVKESMDEAAAARELVDSNVIYFSTTPEARITETFIRTLNFKLPRPSKKKPL